MGLRIGVDCGGTFTDFVCIDENGEIRDFKESSTPDDFSRGVMVGLEKAATDYGKSLESFLSGVDLIVHGTTVATNTVLTLTGAETGVITTAGFRDILEFRRGMKENTFDWREDFPKPLAPRHMRMEVPERVLHTGEVMLPLDEEAARVAVRKLKEKGVEAIAVCFLYSFLHPEHEERVGEIIQEEMPDAFVSLSCRVLPQVREYERVSTTALDAYVGPRLGTYLLSLDESLRKVGFKGTFLIMQSNGGTQSRQEAASRPVTCLSSGPAASVPAGMAVGEGAGKNDLISVDMGGTSCDVVFIEGKKIPMISQGGIYRSIGDYTNASPSIDLIHIGAGGGSIASLDAGGILRVGPRSAGANPGPTCYGRGGEEPTVTDADLILGILPAGQILGGEMNLDRSKAEEVLKEKIAAPLGVDVTEAARAIYAVTNTIVAGAVANAAHRRGLDVRDFSLLMGGGLGPAHAASIAFEMRIPYVIAPKGASTYCAFGMLLSDIRHNYVHSFYTTRDGADLERINSIFQEMEERGRKTLKEEGVSETNMEFRRALDMRYRGQFYEIEIPVPEGEITEQTLDKVVELYHKFHDELYAFSVEDKPTEMLNYKLVAIGELQKPSVKPMTANGTDPSRALRDSRSVYFDEVKEFVDAQIFDGNKICAGDRIVGPAIVEEPFTTVAIPPDFKCEVDPFGNYVIEVQL